MIDLPHANRVAIFVDGANLFKSAEEKRVPVDYAWLRQRLAGNRQAVSAFYFGSYKREPVTPEETSRERAFEEMLHGAGFELRLRPLKAEPFGLRVPRGVEFHASAGPGVDIRIYEEKGVDVALVTEMLTRAWDGEFDVAVLVSGDGDYSAAVRELVRHGKEVEVAAFLHSASTELRRSATRFIDLATLLTQG